jgi:hypothetical protein
MTDSLPGRADARNRPLSPRDWAVTRRPAPFPAPPVTRERASPLPPPAPPTNSVLVRHPVAPPITITHERSLTGLVAERLLASYHQNIAPLTELAILHHLDDREHMLGLFKNPRVVKVVAWQGQEPIGLGLVTNHLDEVVEISPAFLRARYPDEASRDAVYVAMLVMASPGARSMTVSVRLYVEMLQIPARVDGVLVFDVCEFNRVTFGVEAMADRVVGSFPGSTFEVLDRQTWFVAKLPEPLPDPVPDPLPDRSPY